MSDNANPLKTYHQRQIEDQAQPVRLYGENGGPATIQLSGSSQDLRGTIANRPAADAVEVGTTYWAVDRTGETNEMSVSDGSTWTNL